MSHVCELSFSGNSLKLQRTYLDVAYVTSKSKVTTHERIVQRVRIYVASSVPLMNIERSSASSLLTFIALQIPWRTRQTNFITNTLCECVCLMDPCSHLFVDLVTKISHWILQTIINVMQLFMSKSQ